MTNGGGVVDADRVKLLSRDLGVEVRLQSQFGYLLPQLITDRRESACAEPHAAQARDG